MKNAPPEIESYLRASDVHEVHRLKPGGLAVFIAAAVVLVVENLLLYWMLNGKLQPLAGLLLHLAIVGILAAYARLLMGSDRENRFAVLLALTVALTGPFGAGGVMLAVMMHDWLAYYALPFSEWFESIFPSQRQTQGERIYNDIRVGRDESAKSYSVIPFLDVMTFGNEAQKRQALSKMTSNFHPHFAPAFKKALNDPSNMIRVQAATAITKIESHFLSRLMQLTQLKERHPGDYVVLLALAEHYDDYAYTGLLDIDREQINRRKALEYYKEYLHIVPGNAEVRGRVGRILMRDQAYEKARDWLFQCIERGYLTDTISQWYSEALFACGEYETLRRYRTALPKPVADGPVSPLQDALQLWSGGRA